MLRYPNTLLPGQRSHALYSPPHATQPRITLHSLSIECTRSRVYNTLHSFSTFLHSLSTLTLYSILTLQKSHSTLHCTLHHSTLPLHTPTLQYAYSTLKLLYPTLHSPPLYTPSPPLYTPSPHSHFTLSHSTKCYTLYNILHSLSTFPLYTTPTLHSMHHSTLLLHRSSLPLRTHTLHYSHSTLHSVHHSTLPLHHSTVTFHTIPIHSKITRGNNLFTYFYIYIVLLPLYQLVI